MLRDPEFYPGQSVWSFTNKMKFMQGMFTKKQWKGHCELLQNTISSLSMHSNVQQMDSLSFCECYFSDFNGNTQHTGISI